MAQGPAQRFYLLRKHHAGDLVCFHQDLGDNTPKGKFCNFGWVEAIGEVERVE